MTDVPTTNPIASTTASTIDEIIMDLEPAVETAIIAWQGWLATPVVRQLWSIPLQALFNLIAKCLGLVGGYVAIDIQRFNALNNAAQALVALQAAQQSGDQNAIATANANMDSAVAPVLHYVGSIK